jgi:predicted O-methyltransferase YrrM
VKKIKLFGLVILSLSILFIITDKLVFTESPRTNSSLDEKVRSFLDRHARQWHDLNIPEEDGQTLFDLIVKNRYQKALEIGTSTGHSGIWIAWALSKTGGRLITIEIDEARHKEALAHFQEAGLADYIDARLGDAHVLVPQIKGPIDFVFSDADKEWYKNYFLAVEPKLRVGGCFTAHNVYPSRGRRWGYDGGSQEFLTYVESLPQYETTVNTAGAGLSISYKKQGN